MQKNIILILFLFLVISFGFAQQVYDPYLTTYHPSLLMHKEDESRIKKAVASSTHLSIVQTGVFRVSDDLIGQPTLTYLKNGNRLLDVSRECLRRVFFLSYAYRMTGKTEYAKRAEQELLAVCTFPDWNPTHFLDVAELTTATAIGYDWLYDYLPETSRKIIAQSIIEKGLKASENSKDAYFLKAKTNWNQVCNAGMIFGAIAIRETNPALAKYYVERSLKSLPLAMATYEPDGNTDEGYMYWGYGTGFNCMLISAIEKFMGKVLFPSDKIPGFIKTASYILHMVGPTNRPFDYGDNQTSTRLNSAPFWIASRTQNPSLLFNELKMITPTDKSLEKLRVLPLVLIWGSEVDFRKIQTPKENFFIGRGATPVCMMRSSWTDPKAIYVGVKLGSPSENHAHMDVGSFVIDALGERWASDLGMVKYEILEKQKLGIWKYEQNAGRWKIYIYNNLAHNTLTFNESLQSISGSAGFKSFTNTSLDMSCTTDLSSLYKDQVKSIERTVALKDKSYVLIKDKIVALNATRVRWTMVTEAKPFFDQEKGEILLEKNGKKMKLHVDSSIKFKLTTWTPQHLYNTDFLLENKSIIGFEADLSQNQSATFNVTIAPDGTNTELRENLLGKQKVLISPNPFRDETIIQSNFQLENAEVAVYNTLGQSVKTIKNIAGNNIILQRNNLPSGMYFYRLTEGSIVLSTWIVIAN